MPRAAIIGESLRIYGYGLAGALLCPASDQADAVGAWHQLPGDVAVAVLTPQAATWLASELELRPDIVTVVLPEPAWQAAEARDEPASGPRPP